MKLSLRNRKPRTFYNRSVYSLYSLLLFLALVVSLPWWLLQMWRHGKYRSGWRERLGRVPERLRHPAEETIWIHAVSVGEVQAVTPLIQQLRQQLPAWRVVVSTTTDTGQRLARQRFGEDSVFYLPLDLPFAVRPYFVALRPKLLVLAESEFWPNLLRWAKLSGAAIAVVNARVSDRSLPGYLRFRRLLHSMLGNIDLFLAQSEEDASRLIRIGAPAERVQTSGNLKFAVSPPANVEIVRKFAEALRRDAAWPVIIAGSTLEGEEGQLLNTFRVVRNRYPHSVLVLAPRHPERFDAVASMVSAFGVGYLRRSEWGNTFNLVPQGVFLLDTIGELAALYQFADLAFVGGSLVPRGGHNIIEAAQFGVPILVGPHTENFRDIIDAFRRAYALRIVTADSLCDTVLQLLAHENERNELGRRALDVMRSQQGAAARTADALLRLLHSLRIDEVHAESRV